MRRRDTLVFWAQATGQRLRTMLDREGLYTYPSAYYIGPHTISYMVRLQHPTPAAIRKLEGMAPTVEHVVGLRPARIEHSQRGTAIQIPNPQPAGPTAAELDQAGRQALAQRGQNGLALIPLGMDAYNRPAIVPIGKHPVMLAVGPPGRGKSEFLRATAAIVASRAPLTAVNFYAVARKANEYAMLASLKHTREIASTADEAYALMEYVSAVLLPERGHTGATLPRLITIVDDYPSLLEERPDLAEHVNRIAGDGRALGLWLWIGTQAAGKKAGTGAGILEDTVTLRVVFKPSTSISGSRSAGQKDSGVNQLSSNKGDAILIEDGESRRIATGWKSEELLAALPADLLGETDHHRPARAAQQAAQQALAALPVLTVEIEERRQPTAAEAAQIVAWIVGMKRAGQDLSKNQITKSIYAGRKCGKRYAWTQDLLDLAEAMLTDPNQANQHLTGLTGLTGTDRSAGVDADQSVPVTPVNPVSAVSETGDQFAGDGEIYANEPVEPMDEAAKFLAMAKAGQIDWSEVSAGKAR